MYGFCYILGGLLLGGLLMIGFVGVQGKVFVVDVCVCIFGQNGQVIMMYINVVCWEVYDNWVDIVWLIYLVFNMMMSGVLVNVLFGMLQIDVVCNMKSVMFFWFSYEEYSVVSGQLLIFDVWVVNINDYCCLGLLMFQFIFELGNDYEIQMIIVDWICWFGVRCVVVDGSVQLEVFILLLECCEVFVFVQVVVVVFVVVDEIFVEMVFFVLVGGLLWDWMWIVEVVVGLDFSQEGGDEGVFLLCLVM